MPDADPFSLHHAYRLALRHGAQLILNPRRQHAVFTGVTDEPVRADFRRVQAWVTQLLEADTPDGVLGRITIMTRHRSACAHVVWKDRRKSAA